MDISLTIDGESYSYHIDDSKDVDSVDFMDAIIGFESVLKAAYPSFEGHDLVALCPDGSVHEGDDDDDGASSDTSDGRKLEPDGGIDLGKKE